MSSQPARVALPGTARSLLVSWANGQDAWIRQLVSNVMVTGKEVSVEQIEELYDLLLREKALRCGETVSLGKLRDDVLANGLAETLTINSLEQLQNVNALASGQCISFNAILTVIFGENASGKTGYVRVLKRAAGVRTADPVLPNLNLTASAGIPSAKLNFSLGGQQQSLDWHDDAGVAPLNRVDIFDARAAALHVDGDLTYIYTPGELARFPLVQKGIQEVRGKLERDISDATVGSNPFAAFFDRAIGFYNAIESLGAASDLAVLRNLATVSDEERSLIPTLRTEIDALRSSAAPQAQLKVAENQKQELELLLGAMSVLSAFDSTVHARALEQLKASQADYDRATHSVFANVSIPGLFGQDWQRFIQAGEEYLKHHGTAKYPAEDDSCIYCRQPLAEEAVALIKKYRDYCSGQFRAAVNTAREELGRIESPMRAINAAAQRQNLRDLVEGGTVATADGEALNGVLEKLEGLIQAADARQAYSWEGKKDQVKSLESKLETVEKHLTAFISDIKDRTELRQKTLKEREAQLLDIEARIRLLGLLPEIEKFVEKAKWADKAGIQFSRFPAILRSLTETSKTASEQLLNRDFENRFVNECTKLRAPKVKLLFPGRQGQVSRKKTVATDRRLSEVLSEGEQKVIALADFLAEIAQKPVAPVVFDDPITSLDYRRMTEAVKRIVELTQKRQVIVFTHNIWFATELLAEFEKRPDECAYYDVSREQDRVGIVTKGTHPRVDTFKSIKGRINQIIHDAAKLAGESQAALIEKGYEYLRNICEVIVETELLQNVTQRYQPNVRMTALPNIKCDRLKPAIDAISPIYEDCCRYIGSHSQPLETLNVRPNFEQLKKDWANVEAARDAYIKAS